MLHANFVVVYITGVIANYITGICIFGLSGSCDLDLMTFIYEPDAYPLQIYGMYENNILCQGFRKLSC